MSAYTSIVNREINRVLHARGLKIKDLRGAATTTSAALSDEEETEIRRKVFFRTNITLTSEELRLLFRSKIKSLGVI